MKEKLKSLDDFLRLIFPNGIPTYSYVCYACGETFSKHGKPKYGRYKGNKSKFAFCDDCYKELTSEEKLRSAE